MQQFIYTIWHVHATFTLAQGCPSGSNICKLCTYGVPKIPGNLPEWVPHTKTTEKLYINKCPQKLYVSRYHRTTTWPQSLDFYLLGYLRTQVNSVPTAHEQTLHQRIFDARQPVRNLHETFKIIWQSMIRRVNACIILFFQLGLEHILQMHRSQEAYCASLLYTFPL